MTPCLAAEKVISNNFEFLAPDLPVRACSHEASFTSSSSRFDRA